MKAQLNGSIRIASIVFTIAALAVAGFGGSARAESATPATATNGSVTTVNATVGDDMRITLDRYSAPAGIVRFLVTNTGAITHELVVLKTDLAADQLVADPDQPGKVVEEVHMGETSDISAGRFSGLGLPLGAGHYVILCNEIGHYMAGMHVDFTVTAAVVNVSLNDSMSITLDQNVIYAGPVLFAVSNRGAVIHEFVVLATDVPADMIPVDPAEPTKVSEDTNIGETGDITALRFSGLTLDLAPGVYTVICNEPGHFMAGMHATLTVLPAPGGDE
jgi:uncharacterized cupredoxin-like copper-binding protein